MTPAEISALEKALRRDRRLRPISRLCGVEYVSRLKEAQDRGFGSEIIRECEIVDALGCSRMSVRNAKRRLCELRYLDCIEHTWRGPLFRLPTVLPAVKGTA